MNTFQNRPLHWHYVNLRHREDRNTHALAEFERHGISARRFEAYTPDDYVGDERKVARMRARTPGAIGCYMSQMAIIGKAKKDNVVVVCEDDVCFCEDLPRRMQYIERHLDCDWDIFYLGATFHVPGKWCNHPDCEEWGHLGRDAEPTTSKHIMRVYGEWGTYAYMVNGANADKVLQLLEENCYLSDGIDHNFIRLGDKINAYCFVPGCAWQFDNESDIGNGVTRFSGFKKLGPYAWTRFMDDFDPEKFEWEQGL